MPNFLKLPPGLYLGEAMGVATNSKGHIFVYTRSANTRLFEFDQNGNYVREIGEGNYGFEFAHSVRVDPEDNIWAVDEGTNMVIKFNPAGRIVMVLGHRPDAVAGAVATTAGPTPPAEKYMFGRPTDVAWDPQGNIFVSDGYVNNRVVKYDKNGRFLDAGGQRESRARNPASSTLPHGIAVDAQGNVYVADRANHRMQVFDNNLVLQGNLRQHRRFLDGLRFAGPASVSVHFQLESQRQCPGYVGHHRRDLQDGTGRHDPRQVRPCQQAARRVPGGSHDGLPQPERDPRGGDRIVASTETHVEAAVGEDYRASRNRRGTHETILADSCSPRRCLPASRRAPRSPCRRSPSIPPPIR